MQDKADDSAQMKRRDNGNLIDINEQYQRMVMKRVDAEFSEVLDEAREFRGQIDQRLETLAEVIPSALTNAERIAHEALVRRLVLGWLRCHACIRALTPQASDQELQTLLFK